MLRHKMISAVLMAGILMGGLPAQASTTPLTNNDVTTLAQAGVGEDIIVAAIQAQDPRFDISVPALLKLKQEGISPKVLHAMVAAMSQRSAASSEAAPLPINSQPATAPDQVAVTPQAAAIPSTDKRSWHKAAAAFGAVGRALSTAGVNVADGSGQVGGSFKNSFLSGFKNALDRQSGAYAAGTSNQYRPTDERAAFGAASQEQANGYYATSNGNVIPVQNRAQAAQAGQYENYGTPGADLRSTSAQSGGQAGTSFTTWRDPREGAFTIKVPQGWQVSGGTLRTSAMDPHPVVFVTSPDRSIQLFYGDTNLIPREVPNQLTAFARIPEGQTMRAAWGGPILLARYQTGEQFSRSYAASKLCRAPQITDSGTLSEASRQLNAAAMAYGRAQGASAQAWVGETNFQCGSQTGYVRASTVLAGYPTGQGAAIWGVLELSGFMAADRSQAAVARYILNNMVGGFQVDPQWEARQAQTTRDVTGAVTRAQHQMAVTIAQNARQQAQSNQIDVMSGWEQRNKVMDGVMKRDSDTRLGITTATDDITGSHTVTNDYSYHWTRPDGTITGTNTDTPPDYSSGWRMMKSGN